ncbi:MAG: nickel pincer cofactor biosynthesis protein LarC [Planctomycetes bacterium]|nr:nickel pincer cofactor biosynthesis protein LarC [Planctomycetota bacterium]
MSELYVEAFGGLAGDMFLAALLDLDDARFTLPELQRAIGSLVPGGCSLELSSAWRGNLSGKHLEVRTSESGTMPHRGYESLKQLVQASSLPASAQARALAVLWRIAVAEGRVHGCAPEEIHFHEIGAVDTLVDVCGAAFALERLGVTRVFASPPLVGSGTVKCAHGVMPVPAPAVAELLRGRELLHGGGCERLTPTGAALLAELCEDFTPPAHFRTEQIGYGAGTRDPKEGPPNLCRVQLGTSGVGVARPARAQAWLGELQLDDMTGEEIGVALGALREAGALDVWWTSAAMKKDRPGVLVSFLAREDARAKLEAVVFEHTTSLGLRWREVERVECGREVLEVEVEGQRVRVKHRVRPEYPGRSHDGERDLSPEHDDVARAAAALGLSLREVERRAIDLARARIA